MNQHATPLPSGVHLSKLGILQSDRMRLRLVLFSFYPLTGFFIRKDGNTQPFFSWQQKEAQHPQKRFHCFALFVLLFVFQTGFGQQSTITGKVRSGDSVLSGVTVVVKNTGTATKTGDDGAFTVKAAPKATLVFTSIGFETQEVKLTSDAPLDINLVVQNQSLNDVVVVGYATQRKGSVTGAVSSINSADLMRTPQSTTSGALVGKVQGITARQTTGRPGASTAIEIRNLGAPLYVIDGVPQSEGQFNNISAEDIENISILKDASATVYGFRASNGVVLVTTKKGRINRSSFNVNTYYALQNVTRYPAASNAYTYVRALAEAEQNEGRPVTTTPEILEKWRQGTEKGFQSTNYRSTLR